MQTPLGDVITAEIPANGPAEVWSLLAKGIPHPDQPVAASFHERRFTFPWPLSARTSRVFPVATAFPVAIAVAHDWE
jgi:hypothetical protein